MYKEGFIKSWKDLKNNPILFLPDVIIILVNMLLGFFFLKYSGLLKLITDPDLLLRELSVTAPIIKLFFKENILRIIIAVALFALTSFVIGSGLTAMKLGMMKELVSKRNLTIRKMINNGKYVWQVILMKMIMFVIGIVIFLFILGTGLILSTFLHKGIIILFITILFPTLIIALQLLLLFRYQTMFLKNINPIMAVKESFEYFNNNKKYVFIIWLIIVVISFITAPLSAYLGFTQEKIIFLSTAMILGYLVRQIIRMIVNVWSDMFKFRSYKLKL